MSLVKCPECLRLCFSDSLPAQDTSELGRKVALKILADEVAADKAKHHLLPLSRPLYADLNRFEPSRTRTCDPLVKSQNLPFC
jgi:hypothetical protein